MSGRSHLRQGNDKRDARANLPHAPIKAALAAQIAVAISILSFAPIRLGNLVAVRIDENLIRPGGTGSPFWLIFPHYDVKNRVRLEFTFDDDITALIDEYVHEYRPHLMRGTGSDYLFPGVCGKPKTARCSVAWITTCGAVRPAHCSPVLPCGGCTGPRHNPGAAGRGVLGQRRPSRSTPTAG